MDSKWLLRFVMGLASIFIISLTAGAESGDSLDLPETFPRGRFYLHSITLHDGQTYSVPWFSEGGSKAYYIDFAVGNVDRVPISNITVSGRTLCNTFGGGAAINELAKGFEVKGFQADQTLIGCTVAAPFGFIPFFNNWAHTVTRNFPRVLSDVDRAEISGSSLTFHDSKGNLKIVLKRKSAGIVESTSWIAFIATIIGAILACLLLYLGLSRFIFSS